MIAFLETEFREGGQKIKWEKWRDNTTNHDWHLKREHSISSENSVKNFVMPIDKKKLKFDLHLSNLFKSAGDQLPKTVLRPCSGEDFD